MRDDPSLTLAYEAPMDRRQRAAQKTIPDTKLGMIACAITGLSIFLALIGIGCAWFKVGVAEWFLGWSALIAGFVGLPAGIPLSIGGLADEGHRKRFAVIGLIASLGWPVLILVAMVIAVR